MAKKKPAAEAEVKDGKASIIFTVEEIKLPNAYLPPGTPARIDTPLRKGPHSFKGTKHKLLYPAKPGYDRDPANPAMPKPVPADWDKEVDNE